MAEYRWNVTEIAEAWDQAAEHVHPFYVEVHEVIIGMLPCEAGASFLVVDAGGGPGRLVERLLDRFPRARAVLFDQSEAFLALAQRRLARFGGRAACRLCRLQDDWTALVPEPAAAVVSTSAVHHLEPAEKRGFCRRCFEVLRPGGVMLNGDEVRHPDDAEYLAECKWRVAHMRRILAAGLVPPVMGEALRKWEQRNVHRFGEPKQSGDDCHETIEAQLDYLREAGFERVDAPWRKELWAIMRGIKASDRTA